jgi:predicted Zn-dependent protease
MKKFYLIILIGFTFIFFTNCQLTKKPSSKNTANISKNTKVTNTTANSTGTNAAEEKITKNKIQQELQEEQLLGKLLLENFVKDYGSFHSDNSLNKYIQLAGNNISYQFGRNELVFKFGILNTDEINAYSLPGGYVLLTKGLLEKIKNESELAAVMGHEIAHINQKHIFNTVRKEREVGFAETLSSILSMGKASMGSAMTQAIGESVQLLTQTGMKTEQEFEADEYGILFATQAGYKAQDYLNLLERLQKNSSTTNLSNTHPPFEQRIAKLEALIKNNTISNDLKWDASSIDQRFASAFQGLNRSEKK